MITAERHQLILQMLQANKIVKIQDLVEQLSTSESTIRRDLMTLEKENKLKRVHGGAALVRQSKDEPSMMEKSVERLPEKNRIAQYAASLIEDNDCIFLDAGTTIYRMISHIKARDITVVTNGLNHLPALLEKGIETYLLGGYVKPRTEAVIGQIATQNLNQYHFDKVFMGVNGIHAEVGYTTPDPEEAAVKSIAISRGRDAFVLADYSKMNQITFSAIAGIQAATIITDDRDEEMIHSYKEKTRIEVVSP